MSEPITAEALDALVAKYAKGQSLYASADRIAEAKRMGRRLHNAFPSLAAAITQQAAQIAAKDAALREAITWDGYDETGEPAVWLEQARAALT